MSTLPQTADSRPRALARSRLLRRPVLAAAVVCLLSFGAFWAAQRAAHVSMIDLLVYRAEGWAVRGGHDLYAMRATDAGLPTTYPPFAALLFLPLTLLHTPELRALATAGNLIALVLLVHLSLRLLDGPAAATAHPGGRDAAAPLAGDAHRLPRPAVVLLLAAGAVWCEPVWTTLRYGQINLLLAVLVLWDLTRRPGHRWAGAGIGVAAGIKLTPALFAVFLALCGLVVGVRAVRRGGRADALWNPWLRQAAVAVAAFAGTVAVSWVLLPADSRRFWTDAVFRSDRVGQAVITDNQSLRGLLARLLHTPNPGLPWLAVAGAVAVLGLGTAVAAALAGRRGLPHARAWAALACAVTALLVSPVSWSHHWVWCVPLVLLLGAEARRVSRAGRARRDAGGASAPVPPGRAAGRLRAAAAGAVPAAAVLVFCSYALWYVPHASGTARPPELGQSAGEMALSAVYPAAGTVFLALAAAVSVRALRPRPEKDVPPAPGAARPDVLPG